MPDNNVFLLLGIPIGIGITLFTAFSDISLNGIGTIGGIGIAALSAFAYLQFSSSTATSESSSVDDRAESDVSDSASTESNIVQDESDNEDSEMLAADGAGAKNPPARIIEDEMEESEQVKQDAEKVDEIQNNVYKLLNEETQLKKKLQSLTSDHFMRGNVEDAIENRNPERLMDVLNQMPDDVEIESLKDLKAQAENLEEVIQLESEAEEIVKDQIQHLENQLQYEEKELEQLKAESDSGAENYKDEELGQMIEECKSRVIRTEEDIEKSRKVLKEIKEVEALESQHEQMVEEIVDMVES
jgi:DNA repair exonuclease SbcCD ATPase subunit